MSTITLPEMVLAQVHQVAEEKDQDDIDLIVAAVERYLAELRQTRGAVHWAEPEIYVGLDADSISFETPADKVYPFLLQLANDLPAGQIRVSLDQNGRTHMLRPTPARLGHVLEANRQVLDEEPMTIEYGTSTLYSMGGGCLLLKTPVGMETKRQIVQHFLALCGYPYEVRGSHFEALVRQGRLEVFRE